MIKVLFLVAVLETWSSAHGCWYINQSLDLYCAIPQLCSWRSCGIYAYWYICLQKSSVWALTLCLTREAHFLFALQPANLQGLINGHLNQVHGMTTQCP